MQAALVFLVSFVCLEASPLGEKPVYGPPLLGSPSEMAPREAPPGLELPRDTIAIGNSFNTGKRGKATSHATSFARLEAPTEGYLYDPPTDAPFEETPTAEPSIQEPATENLPTTTQAPRKAKKTPKKDNPFLNFFPINFGRGRSGIPIGTVAIANSFNTGRNGVATSNAMTSGAPARLEASRGMMVVGVFDEGMEEPKFFTVQMDEPVERDDSDEADDDDDDDDDAPSWPFFGRSQGGVSFFPITFGRLSTPARLEEPQVTTTTTEAPAEEIPEENPEETPEETSVADTPVVDAPVEKSPKGWPIPRSFTQSVGFFPIRFGSGQGSVAVANSFSTGSKGRASSTATSGRTSARLEEATIEQPQEVPQEAPKEAPREVPQSDEEEDDAPILKSPGTNFFPIFWSARSGTVAVANSFSTGSKGRATSTASSGAMSARLEEAPTEQPREDSDAKTLQEDQEDQGHEEERDEEDNFPLFRSSPGSFFPIYFRSTSGSVAVANSFSTGSKGRASSTATSGPKTARLEEPPVEQSEEPTETPEEDVEEMDGDDDFKLFKSNGVTFFPIYFASSGRSPSSTSIANSFNTGRKGSATSHAMSRSKRQTDEVPEEDLPEESSTEDADSFVRSLQGSGYNFFPINFSGFGGRSGDDPEGNAAGTVAIANSFSTGRGGTANSQATAYGFPKNLEKLFEALRN